MRRMRPASDRERSGGDLFGEKAGPVRAPNCCKEVVMEGTDHGAISCTIDLAIARRWVLSEGLVLYKALRNA